LQTKDKAFSDGGLSESGSEDDKPLNKRGGGGGGATKGSAASGPNGRAGEVAFHFLKHTTLGT